MSWIVLVSYFNIKVHTASWIISNVLVYLNTSKYHWHNYVHFMSGHTQFLEILTSAIVLLLYSNCIYIYIIFTSAIDTINPISHLRIIFFVFVTKSLVQYSVSVLSNFDNFTPRWMEIIIREFLICDGANGF